MDKHDMDIYDDLDEFHKDEEKKSSELKYCEEKYNEALRQIEAVQLENKDMKKKLKRIELNFQNLLDTAKAEIKRKDTMITQLRKDMDDICFRRKRPNTDSVYRSSNEHGEHSATSNTSNPSKTNKANVDSITVTEVTPVANGSLQSIRSTFNNKPTKIELTHKPKDTYINFEHHERHIPSTHRRHYKTNFKRDTIRHQNHHESRSDSRYDERENGYERRCEHNLKRRSSHYRDNRDDHKEKRIDSGRSHAKNFMDVKSNDRRISDKMDFQHIKMKKDNMNIKEYESSTITNTKDLIEKHKTGEETKQNVGEIHQVQDSNQVEFCLFKDKNTNNTYCKKKRICIQDYLANTRKLLDHKTTISSDVTQLKITEEIQRAVVATSSPDESKVKQKDEISNISCKPSNAPPILSLPKKVELFETLFGENSTNPKDNLNDNLLINVIKILQQANTANTTTSQFTPLNSDSKPIAENETIASQNTTMLKDVDARSIHNNCMKSSVETIELPGAITKSKFKKIVKKTKETSLVIIEDETNDGIKNTQSLEALPTTVTNDQMKPIDTCCEVEIADSEKSIRLRSNSLESLGNNMVQLTYGENSYASDHEKNIKPKYCKTQKLVGEYLNVLNNKECEALNNCEIKYIDKNKKLHFNDSIATTVEKINGNPFDEVNKSNNASFHISQAVEDRLETSVVNIEADKNEVKTQPCKALPAFAIVDQIKCFDLFREDEKSIAVMVSENRNNKYISLKSDSLEKLGTDARQSKLDKYAVATDVGEEDKEEQKCYASPKVFKEQLCIEKTIQEDEVEINYEIECVDQEQKLETNVSNAATMETNNVPVDEIIKSITKSFNLCTAYKASIAEIVSQNQFEECTSLKGDRIKALGTDDMQYKHVVKTVGANVGDAEYGEPKFCAPLNVFKEQLSILKKFEGHEDDINYKIKCVNKQHKDIHNKSDDPKSKSQEEPSTQSQLYKQSLNILSGSNYSVAHNLYDVATKQEVVNTNFFNEIIDESKYVVNYNKEIKNTVTKAGTSKIGVIDSPEKSINSADTKTTATQTIKKTNDKVKTILEVAVDTVKQKFKELSEGDESNNGAKIEIYVKTPKITNLLIGTDTETNNSKELKTNVNVTADKQNNEVNNKTKAETSTTKPVSFECPKTPSLNVEFTKNSHNVDVSKNETTTKNSDCSEVLTGNIKIMKIKSNLDNAFVNKKAKAHKKRETEITTVKNTDEDNKIVNIESCCFVSKSKDGEIENNYEENVNTETTLIKSASGGVISGSVDFIEENSEKLKTNFNFEKSNMRFKVGDGTETTTSLHNIKIEREPIEIIENIRLSTVLEIEDIATTVDNNNRSKVNEIAVNIIENIANVSPKNKKIKELVLVNLGRTENTCTTSELDAIELELQSLHQHSPHSLTENLNATMEPVKNIKEKIRSEETIIVSANILDNKEHFGSLGDVEKNDYKGSSKSALGDGVSFLQSKICDKSTGMLERKLSKCGKMKLYSAEELISSEKKKPTLSVVGAKEKNLLCSRADLIDEGSTNIPQVNSSKKVINTVVKHVLNTEMRQSLKNFKIPKIKVTHDKPSEECFENNNLVKSKKITVIQKPKTEGAVIITQKNDNIKVYEDIFLKKSKVLNANTNSNEKQVPIVCCRKKTIEKSSGTETTDLSREVNQVKSELKYQQTPKSSVGKNLAKRRFVIDDDEDDDETPLIILKQKHRARRILSPSDDDDDNTAKLNESSKVAVNTIVVSTINTPTTTFGKRRSSSNIDVRPKKLEKKPKLHDVSMLPSPIPNKILHITNDVDECILELSQTPTKKNNDLQLNKIESRMQKMFQSPLHTTNKEIFDITVNSAVKNIVPCDMTSQNNLTIEETLLNESSYQHTSSGGVLTKSCTLGSSDYRFEQISENVVKLVVTRRGRKRKSKPKVKQPNNHLSETHAKLDT